MKKRILLSSVIICIVMLASVCFAIGSSTGAIKFTLEQFKMKVGSTQSLAAVINGKNINYNFLQSSNEGVVAINGMMLKAVSTGTATLTYHNFDQNGEDNPLYCFVEVTRDYSTFDTVGGNNKEEITIGLVVDDITISIKSANAAIPKYPTISKVGKVFDGWYLDSEYTNKVKDDQRFNKDVYLYGKWISPEEAKAKLPVAAPMYEDVVDHWARSAIESVSYLGLFKGVSDTKFGPENKMTRAMTVAVIGRLEKAGEDGASIQGFKLDVKDVDNSSYYAPYLAWAIDNKIVTDLNDGNFRPTDEITREEMAIYMYNYIKYKGFKYDLKITASYGDSSSFSKEGREAADVLYNLNIMQGNQDGTFSPKASLTRAQIAQIFFNYNNFVMKYKG